MNIKEAKIGDKVWVEGIINSSFSNGGVHVNHAGVDAFYDLERTKIKPDGYAGQSPKYLKNIIAKMRELPEHDRAVWIKGIFKEFGIENDISYYLGHKQGVLQAKDSLKPEVPQFLADWYEKHKDNLEYYIWEYIAEWDNQEKDDFFDFMNFSAFKPIQTLVNMHQFGYTIKKEKLYTVEIPDPNHDVGTVILSKNKHREAYIAIDYTGSWKERKANHLTESEIRKDFDWAWQFAKEVTE
ncbi:TPA: DUF1642 domain-containing protein [Streptococcus pyogenes]|nr:DUF1642 domain-containing protein [Streptococcus pyogenes]HER5560267.1 DUF1642 domain-containing protein [Streptococcus pyogenes]